MYKRTKFVLLGGGVIGGKTLGYLIDGVIFFFCHKNGDGLGDVFRLKF